MSSPRSRQRVEDRTGPARTVVLREKLSQLAAALGITNEQLVTQKLGLSRIAPAHWATGRTWPSEKNFIALAKLAKDTKLPALSLWFVEQIGIDDDLLRALIPDIDAAFREHEKRVRKAAHGSEMLPIPRVVAPDFFDHPHLPPKGDQIVEMTSIAKRWIDSPAHTVCFEMTEKIAGTAFGIGDVLILDMSVRDWKSLFGKLVLVNFSGLDQQDPVSRLRPTGLALGQLSLGSQWTALFWPVYRRLELDKEQIPILDPHLWQGAIPIEYVEKGREFTFKGAAVWGRAMGWINREGPKPIEPSPVDLGRVTFEKAQMKERK